MVKIRKRYEFPYETHNSQWKKITEIFKLLIEITENVLKFILTFSLDDSDRDLAYNLSIRSVATFKPILPYLPISYLWRFLICYSTNSKL